MIEGDLGPGASLIDDRLRKSKQWLTLAVCLMPTLMVVGQAAYIFRDLDERRSMLSSLALGCVALGFCVRYRRTRALLPGRWVRTATNIGAVAGVFTNLSVSSLISLSPDPHDDPFRYFGTVLAVMAVCGVLGALASRWLATQAKEFLLTPFDDVLVHSAVEIPFAARGERRRTLLVGTDTITETRGDSDGNSTRKHPLAQVTDARRTVAADGGPAVVIDVAGDRWTVPTDEPDRILRTLRGRAKAGAK